MGLGPLCQDTNMLLHLIVSTAEAKLCTWNVWDCRDSEMSPSCTVSIVYFTHGLIHPA